VVVTIQNVYRHYPNPGLVVCPLMKVSITTAEIDPKPRRITGAKTIS
jgi:hypothetical protein